MSTPNAAVSRAVVRRAWCPGGYAGWDVLIVKGGYHSWADRVDTRAEARRLARHWNTQLAKGVAL